MENGELLLTLADVSVAFAGFAGLAGVLKRHFAPTDHWIAGARLRGLVENALIALAFTLLPFVLERLGLTGNLLWRAASFLFGLSWGASGLLAMRLHRRAASVGGPRIPHVRNTVFLVVFLTSAVQILNSLGLFDDWADAIYLIGLYAALAVSGILFMRLMAPMAPLPTPTPGGDGSVENGSSGTDTGAAE